jgi:hypothetical protein
MVVVLLFVDLKIQLFIEKLLFFSVKNQRFPYLFSRVGNFSSLTIGNPTLYSALYSYGMEAQQSYHIGASSALELKGYTHL